MPSNYTRRISLYINGKEVKNEIASIKTEMYKLISTQARMTIGSKEYVAAGTEIRKLKGIITEHNASLRNTESTTSKLVTQFKELLPALSIGAVIGFFANIGKQIFTVQEKFQTFAAVLKTALGSKGAAASSLQMIQEFAAKTPFSVEGLTNSFIKLVNRGFRPTKEELTKMGDLASSTGKDFDMLVEAILDAETGEFERLKEFGIKAKVSGDQVTMTFKGVKTTMDNNAESIRAYLVGLGELNGIMGSMAGISETLSGKTSNLGDSWTTFMKVLGDGKTIFSDVVGGLTDILNAATWAVKSLAQIREEVEVSIAGENVKAGMHEIEVMTASLVRRGVELNTAKKQAYELYKAQRSKQLSDMNRDIATTGAQLKVYTIGINGFKASKAMNNLLLRKSDLESRQRMLADEVDQIKALKDAEIDYTKTTTDYSKLSIKQLTALVKKGDELAKAELLTRKNLTDGIKDAFKELEKQITDLDTKINNAINAGDLALVQKFTAEKQALELLLATHKEVKSQIEKGWSVPGEIKSEVDSMDPKGYKTVKPLKGLNNILNKRDTGLAEKTPEEIAEENAEAERLRVEAQEKEAQEIKEAYTEMAWESAQVLNDSIFSIVRNRQQAEFDHAMYLLEKEREAELSNKNLTEKQIAAINDKYDKKADALKLKQFKKEQNAAYAMAVVNGALAITKTFTAYPWPAGIPMAIAQGVATAAQIAVISSQEPPEYYEGGFTKRDASNRKVAGVVHANEYVIPQEGLKNPQIRAFANMIEVARQNRNLAAFNPSLFKISAMGGFAGGGYTSKFEKLEEWSKMKFDPLGQAERYVNKMQNEILMDLAQTVGLLNKQLGEGIEASVSVRGRNGINEKLAEDKEIRKNAYL